MIEAFNIAKESMFEMKLVLAGESAWLSDEIFKAREEGKSVFIYNEYVKGSGLILFGLILNLFGFAKADGSEPPGSKKARYASLTNETTTNKQITDLISRFNDPDNMNGEIINVIMGSRKISEGFSFKNIQVELRIITFWYRNTLINI